MRLAYLAVVLLQDGNGLEVLNTPQVDTSLRANAVPIELAAITQKEAADDHTSSWAYLVWARPFSSSFLNSAKAPLVPEATVWKRLSLPDEGRSSTKE